MSGPSVRASRTADSRHWWDVERPMLATTLRGYSAGRAVRDIQAGLTVGVVALPLAIAFAIASGVKPEQGLFTAIVAGFLISALGGSTVQIGGPTGAFIVTVAATVHQFGYAGLAVATLMAGVILVVMGIARMGDVIKFVPYPLTVGFTAGIAVIIAGGQVKDFLGVHPAAAGADVLGQLAADARALGSWTPASCAVAAGALLITVLWPRVSRRVPGPLVAVVAATLVTALFHVPAETIAQRFGGVPSTLPTPSLPHVPWTMLRQLAPVAFTIALLAAIESLLSAVVADGMTGGRHRSNAELVAQGIANIASPVFGGIPATGAIARTATNIKNGATSPIAGMVHAVVLLVILLAAGPLAGHVPIAALSGILLVVAYNMSEWRSFLRMFRGPRSDVGVLLATFTLTIVVDLTTALGVGMVLAALLFMMRMATLSQSSVVTGLLHEGAGDGRAGMRIPRGVEVFEVHGALFFGAVSQFNDALRAIEKKPKVLILLVRDVLAIDASGLHAIVELLRQCRRDRTLLVLAGVHAQPMFALEKAGLLVDIGLDNVVGTLAEAVARGEESIAASGARPER